MPSAADVARWIQERLLNLATMARLPLGAKAITCDLGSGYMTPQPPDVAESRNLDDCHPELKRRYLMLAADFEKETGRQIFLTCTWRSAKRQMEIYQVGRRGVAGENILTKIDGEHSRSRHMVYPAEAVDVCVDTDPGPGKHPVWDDAAYAPLGPLAARHGLIWGGSWTMFRDNPHLELPAEAA